MSKKMKGVATESSIYARFKHQSLIQDYQELQKETDAAKNKLDVMNQRKLTLLAEVRFLRRRYKHLLEMKAVDPRGQKLFQHLASQAHHESSTKQKYSGRKEMKLQSKASMWDPNMKETSSCLKKSDLKTKRLYDYQKERKNNGKEASHGNKSPGFNISQKARKYGAKEVITFKNPSEVLHLKQKDRFFVGKETRFLKRNLGIDLNQMEESCAVREEAEQNQAPVFDLNLKLGEDLQESYETLRSEEARNVFGGGDEVQLNNDLTLSICRNLENVPPRSGKRKISWQDPVALKV